MPDNLTPRERATLVLQGASGDGAEVLHIRITAAIEAAVADYRTLLAQQSQRADEWQEKALDVETHPVVVLLRNERDAAARRADEAERAARTAKRESRKWMRLLIMRAGGEVTALLSELDEAQAEIERCREIAERNGRDYMEMKRNHDAVLAQAAELRRALERVDEGAKRAESLYPGNALWNTGAGSYLQCGVEAARAALAITPGEALAKHDEKVRREAKAEVWEQLADKANGFPWFVREDAAARAAELRKESA